MHNMSATNPQKQGNAKLPNNTYLSLSRGTLITITTTTSTVHHRLHTATLTLPLFHPPHRPLYLMIFPKH